MQSLLALSDAAESDLASVEPSERIPLYLPSSIPQHLWQLPELAIVVEKEHRLRVAQADDALAEIRHQRRIISGLWQFKKFNIDGIGNKAGTRMQTLYNRFNLHTQRYALCYHAARSALLVLDPNGSWLPLAKLTLKVGCPVMVLKNLDAANGVCNGSRGILTRHGNRVLEVKLLTGEPGQTVFIPRVGNQPSD